ncbi:MAG: hypothetical protein R3280_12440 [Marinobacter sp.]|uniref:Flp family type IVb pilin n=1 Tax=Marinobacter sp. TaxID=50741 RepID=UPI00299D2829|nr:hypothetical protein [Marinobacter sp.]MDX1635441.1 hypothetical protein [Marinobacter sp.]
MKKLTTNIKKLANLPTRATIQLQAHRLSTRSKQDGASALEYLVLAGALVAIMVFAFSNDTVQQTVKGIFDGLFAKVPG